MAHFAELDSNNKVLRVVVISNDDVASNGGDKSTQAETFVKNLLGHSENGVTWKQTSYNAKARGEFASVGFLWEPTKEKFYGPKPKSKNSWTLEEKGDRLVWWPPIDFFNTEDCKLADGSDVKITYNNWDDSAQTWKGQHYKIESNGNYTITNFTWNKSTKVWDRD